jgi:hypothetical protein
LQWGPNQPADRTKALIREIEPTAETVFGAARNRARIAAQGKSQ